MRSLSYGVSLLMVIGFWAGSAKANDLIFKKSKIVIHFGGKIKEKKALVTWGNSTVTVRFKNSKDRNRYPGYEGIFLYNRMSNLTYERSRHSRIVATLILSVWAQFIPRKHHWFSWDYVDVGNDIRTVLLRIDKKEQELYRQKVPVITGLPLKINIEP